MNRSKRVIEEILKCCGSIGEEDGLDPKYDSKRDQHSQSKQNYKALQLAQQIKVTLHYVLAANQQLPLDLCIASVTPAPDSRRMRVLVAINTSDENPVDLNAIENALREQTGSLRNEIAQSIHRKKTPNLIFEVIHKAMGATDES